MTSTTAPRFVIRAHGVRPDVMERAEQRGLEVIDGTCTWVIQEHRELTKLVEDGYTIVLLGTPKHAEVVGMLGFAPDAIVVDDEEEWEAAIPRKKRMALISQSTQPPWKFEKLAAFMVSRAHELKIVNTVCPVTIRRQEDTLETAGEVDLMVVVGGRSSANTKELTRLCEIAGTAAVQIESVHDLTDPAVFADARVVGVTGGTSTPIEDLRDVAERILSLAGTPKPRVARPSLRTLRSNERPPRRAARRHSQPHRGPPPRSPRPALHRPMASAKGAIPVVAIVGRPNVGKSTLFNRFLGQRSAIVEDRARTTRDRLYGDADWNGRRFVIVDTGGLELDPDDPIEARVQEQARLAIAEADVILFVVDAEAGITRPISKRRRSCAARPRP
jgi:4-hydroxy-3-methylbut-2-enyl diphosphate reductase